jgi:hypothetical protein
MHESHVIKNRAILGLRVLLGEGGISGIVHTEGASLSLLGQGGCCRAVVAEERIQWSA